VWDASHAQGPEALKVSQKLKEFASNWAHSEEIRGVLAAEPCDLASDRHKTDVIKRVLAKSVGYASLPYIAREAQLDIADAARVLASDRIFRKSLIRTKNGEDVYLLNTPFSWLLDAWKAFCYLNALKY
jgi:hypothetical protein